MSPDHDTHPTPGRPTDNLSPPTIHPAAASTVPATGTGHLAPRTPATITVLAIPADPARPHRLLAINPSDDTTFKDLAGGGCEPIDLEQDGAVLWMGDPPLPASTPLNERATALAAYHPRRFLPDQPIHGDVIITGMVDSDGLDLLDVPAFYARLLDAPRYRVHLRRKYTAGGIILGDQYTSLVAAYHATCDAARATEKRRPGTHLTARVTPVDATPPPPAP
ncbi:hypothetical protein [Frankia sp. ArI3]|uniref:hypothetical protein n=1 Tax=Frankia sp. ArI3 TaxID=1858 RepID=UPI001C6FCDEB|nr:hypothetical protein [Frankia sp. ArI3]